MKYKTVKIRTVFSEVHEFEDVQDLKVNAEKGIIQVVSPRSRFVLLFDRLTFFEVLFDSPRPEKFNFKQARMTLTDLPEPITIPEVISFDWKADSGLFMVFARHATLGVHLDHLISFDMEKIASE